MASAVESKAVSRGIEGAGVYFESLSLQNIRCFGDTPQTIRLTSDSGLPAHWTLILGENGTGKTTLLQCLTMSYGSGFHWLKILAGGPTPDEWSDDIGDFVFYGRRFDRDGCLGRRDCEVLSGIAHIDGSLTSGSVSRSWERRHACSKLKQWSVNAAGGPSVMMAYGPSRRVGPSVLGARRDDPLATLFSDEEQLRNPEEWLLQLDYSAIKESSISQRLASRRDQVRTLLIQLLPDVNDIEISTPTSHNPVPDVRFKTPYGWVPMDEIAYGYQSLLVWIVDFASRMIDAYPDSRDPLTEAAVCLVDEIDLHLHPSWQRDVMRFLSEKFPNTQFIATAHSPLIVQSASSVNANVAVLRRAGDHVVIDNDAEVVRGWRLDQILASDLYNVPARSPDVQAKIDERRKILEKPRLDKGDKQRLKKLEAEIGLLPVGETPEQIKAMQLLQDSVSALQNAVDREA